MKLLENHLVAENLVASVIFFFLLQKLEYKGSHLHKGPQSQ